MSKHSEIQKEYQKEYRRITRFIKSAEKRGYRFDEKAIPKQVKRPTKASIERLKKITPKVLYAKSTALSETGKIISGIEKQKEVRKIAQQKSWEQRRKKQDKADYEKVSKNIDTTPFSEGKMVYKKILSLISSNSDLKSARLLKDELNMQISEYGFNAVMYSISQAPSDIIEMCEVVLKYAVGSPSSVTALTNLAHLIEGEIPSDDLIRQFEENWSEEYEEV